MKVFIPFIAALLLVGGCETLPTPGGAKRPPAASSSPRPPSVESIVNADGVVSLISKNASFKNRPLYLNGQFGYHCMTELLYAAKSGGDSLEKSVDEMCGQEYQNLQNELRQAQKPYDALALAYGSAKGKAYWQNLVSRHIVTLRSANRFATRFSSPAFVRNTGQISVKPGFGETPGDDDVHLLSVPATVLVELEDTAFANQLRRTGLRTGLGEGKLFCEATWEFLRTEDRQGGNNRSRYEVHFKATQMKCREAR